MNYHKTLILLTCLALLLWASPAQTEARLQGDFLRPSLQKRLLNGFSMKVMGDEGKKGPTLSIVNISTDGKKGHSLFLPSPHPLLSPVLKIVSDFYSESLLIGFEINGVQTFKGRIPNAFSRPRPLPLNLRRSWTR